MVLFVEYFTFSHSKASGFLSWFTFSLHKFHKKNKNIFANVNKFIFLYRSFGKIIFSTCRVHYFNFSGLNRFIILNFLKNVFHGTVLIHVVLIQLFLAKMFIFIIFTLTNEHFDTGNIFDTH